MIVDESDEVSLVPASCRFDDRQRLSLTLLGLELVKSVGAVVRLFVPEPLVLFDE